MTALTEGRNVDRFIDDELRSAKVLANTTIYRGGFLGLSSGFVRPLVAGDEFFGLAYEDMVNAGSNGDKSVRYFPRAIIEHALTGADDAHNKSAVYASDDNTLTYTSTANSFVGWQLALLGTDKILVCLTNHPQIATPLDREYLTQEDLQPYPIKISDLRVWDSPSTNAVVDTAANDDLAVVYNTFGTLPPTIESGDGKAATVTRKVGFQFTVPPEYVAGQTITARINAGMKTTVADTSATVDLEVTRQAAPTADICATAAQSINSLTAANKDFTITPTTVIPGDVLDCVVTIATVDAATATAVIGKINSITMLLDIKG